MDDLEKILSLAEKSTGGIESTGNIITQIYRQYIAKYSAADQYLNDVIKEKGKLAIVHVDLTAGLSSKEIAVDFVRQHTRADGIISTKPQLVKHAMEMGLLGVQRTFIIDSMALSTTRKQIDAFRPDLVEVMPGIMPRILKEIRGYTDIPLIAGGLISDKKDVMAALSAGADGISTTNEGLWLA